MGAVIGPPGEAAEELYDPYHRCAGRAGQAGGVLFLRIESTKTTTPRGEVYFYA